MIFSSIIFLDAVLVIMGCVAMYAVCSGHENAKPEQPGELWIITKLGFVLSASETARRALVPSPALSFMINPKQHV